MAQTASPSDRATTRRQVHELRPPWHLHEIADPEGHVAWQLVDDGYLVPIATTELWDGPGSLEHEQGKAIAYLLAAAPELYQALRLAATWLERYEQDMDAARWSRADRPPAPDYRIGQVRAEVARVLKRARGVGW
jgi:hypothetical protein